MISGRFSGQAQVRVACSMIMQIDTAHSGSMMPRAISSPEMLSGASPKTKAFRRPTGANRPNGNQ